MDKNQLDTKKEFNEFKENYSENELNEATNNFISLKHEQRIVKEKYLLNDDGCSNCYFKYICEAHKSRPCMAHNRRDGNSIYYVKMRCLEVKILTYELQ